VSQYKKRLKINRLKIVKQQIHGAPGVPQRDLIVKYRWPACVIRAEASRETAVSFATTDRLRDNRKNAFRVQSVCTFFGNVEPRPARQYLAGRPSRGPPQVAPNTALHGPTALIVTCYDQRDPTLIRVTHGNVV
jgi:hypothetical protein